MSNMKKFGRGYVLDFTALMNEVRSPNQKPPDDIITTTTNSTSATTNTPTTSTPTSFDVSESSGQSSTNGTDRDFDQNACGADATPSPTEEELLEGMKRRPARMSVSRTGRLKNRDRQRISVLETSEFYGAKPNAGAAATPLPGRGGNNAGHHQHHPTTVRDVGAGRKALDATAGLPNETLADFDGVIAAIDSTIPTQLVKTDCYSF